MANGRRILVTGVARGLGRAFVEAAVARGHRVAGTVRSAADIDKVRAWGVTPVLLDLMDEAAIAPAVGEVEAALGGVDVLVNNAGYGHEGVLEESSGAALRRQFQVGVFAPVALIRALLPGMRAQRSGHIVNVTSMAGSVGLPGISFYCGAKFALEGISESLGKEVKLFGIHVTAFAPGQFRTGWAGDAMDRSPRAIPDYDALFDPLRAARLAKSGRQAGDPAKAAEVLMAVLDAPNPPARVFVGPDALALAGQKVKRLSAEIAGWDAIGRATDFTPSSD